MANDLLGKRRCHAIEHSDIALQRLPRKRRNRAPVVLDEGQDPPIPQTNQDGPQSMEIDGPQQENERPVKQLASGIVTRKHTVSNKRPALSPTKLNALQGKPESCSTATDGSYHTTKACSTSREEAKSQTIVTPSAPRFRDALSNNEPRTPKHLVRVAGRLPTPRTPRTPSTPSVAQSIYGPARRLFARSSVPDRLVGRENERQQVTSFISEALQSTSGGCMYISGPPGTGKSALVDEACRILEDQSSLKVAKVNCMCTKTSKDVYSKLIEELCETMATPKKTEAERLEGLFISKIGATKASYLVVLDEIDHLLATDLDMIYSLFEWSMHRDSRLILIGIANALDLTNRLLPRLKARNLRPKLLPFHPYTAPQIASIITARLESLLPQPNSVAKGFTPFVHPAATQLCSKKVASQTGDLRKAFDIVRRAIDQIERETTDKHGALIAGKLRESPSKGPLTENINLSSPSSPKKDLPTPPKSSPTSPSRYASSATTSAMSLASLTPERAPRATIAHVARITSAIFNNGTTQRLESLNLQQKAALCSLVSIEQRRIGKEGIFGTPSRTSGRASTVRQLFEQYSSLCKRDDVLHPLAATEFRDVVASLETLGLVSEVKGKTGSFQMAITPTKTSSRKARAVLSTAEEKQLASNVSEIELEAAIQGSGISILQKLLKGEE